MSEENIKDPRKLEVMGVNIDITSILGNKIIDQYLAQLSEDDMNTIIKFMDEDIFKTNHNGERCVKSKGDSSWGKTEVMDFVKCEFNKKYKEILLEELLKKLQTDEYKEKIAKVIDEIIEYSIEGYKQDLIACIKQKMINNFFTTSAGVEDINTILTNHENTYHYELRSEIAKIKTRLNIQ